MGSDGESDTSTYMEESDIRFEAECGTDPDQDMDESDGPGEPDTTYVLSADESFMSVWHLPCPLPQHHRSPGHSSEDNKHLCTEPRGAVVEPISGAPVATTLRLLKSINVATVLERTFHYYQQAYLLPAVKQRHNSELLEGLQGKTIDLAGDGRCDSPGNAMEKVAFVCGLTKLKKEDFTIGSFISGM
ncbi:hypothetical protein HPB47_010927 [Ixodes persulcatus]|uniref:Uncharacterized protein n=1 Tax=Ixodes persulcatus TaxID=34615 RepID=A0AC60NXR3_IXOPE|nr:hypothetical protein HPB47_010927 [Ixodes persulcatus]